MRVSETGLTDLGRSGGRSAVLRLRLRKLGLELGKLDGRDLLPASLHRNEALKLFELRCPAFALFFEVLLLARRFSNLLSALRMSGQQQAYLPGGAKHT